MDAERVCSRPDGREEYVDGGSIGETSKDEELPFMGWREVGADDCRPNGGGS